MHTRRDSSFCRRTFFETWYIHVMRLEKFSLVITGQPCLSTTHHLSWANESSYEELSLLFKYKYLLYDNIFISKKKLSGFLGIKLFKKGEKYHFTLVKWGQIWTNVETLWNVHVCTIFSFFKIHRTFFLFLFFPLSYFFLFPPSLSPLLPSYLFPFYLPLVPHSFHLSIPSPYLSISFFLSNLERTGKLISYTRIMHVSATILNKIHIKTFVQHYSNKRKRVLFLNIWKECHFGQVHWNKCGCVTFYLFLEQMSH